MNDGHTTLVYMYPGQGSQRVGMGSGLTGDDAERFQHRLRQAEQLSGLPLREYVQQGPVEGLTRTDVAQPALFALSLTLTEIAGECGLRPAFVMGHSLGEYTAACACGAISFDDALALVVERGRLMAAAQSQRPGAMAAIIGLDAGSVERICEDARGAGHVAVANLNAPTQTVVSGDVGAVERAVALAEEAGASRAIRLPVGAAFHSELMRPAQTVLADRIAALSIAAPRVPLIGNASADLCDDGEKIRAALVRQITSPVRWVECVMTAFGLGCETFLELGPGRTLSGLVRQIEPAAHVLAADARPALQELAARRAAGHAL